MPQPESPEIGHLSLIQYGYPRLQFQPHSTCHGDESKSPTLDLSLFHADCSTWYANPTIHEARCGQRGCYSSRSSPGNGLPVSSSAPHLEQNLIGANQFALNWGGAALVAESREPDVQIRDQDDGRDDHDKNAQGGPGAGLEDSQRRREEHEKHADGDHGRSLTAPSPPRPSAGIRGSRRSQGRSMCRRMLW